MLVYPGKMRDTYNLDAASPRITNKKSSHIICGKTEESKVRRFCLSSDRSSVNKNDVE